MNAKQIRAAIQTAYAALDRACDEHGTEARSLFDRAYEAALESERRHRRFGAGWGRYRQSAETAARYFVVKWFLDPGKVTNAREAAALRLDCLYASALAHTLNSGDSLRSRLASREILAIDYSTHIAGGA